MTGVFKTIQIVFLTTLPQKLEEEHNQGYQKVLARECQEWIQQQHYLGRLFSAQRCIEYRVQLEQQVPHHQI